MILFIVAALASPSQKPLAMFLVIEGSVLLTNDFSAFSLVFHERNCVIE